MAIQSYRPASEGEKPLYIGGKTSETYRAVTYEDRKAGHKTHDLCWFYLQRHVSVEISKKNRRDCTKSRAQCPNNHLRSDAIRNKCGEALEQERNATRHGRNLSVGVRAGSWLGAFAVSLCRSPESQAEDTKQPRTARKKRTVPLPGMYPTELNCGNIGTSRSNEMWPGRASLPATRNRYKNTHTTNGFGTGRRWRGGKKQRAEQAQKVNLDFWRSQF